MFAMLERLVRSNSTVGNKKRPRLEQRRLRLQLESLEDRCEVCGVMPTAFDDEYWWTADEFESLTVDVPGVLGNDNPGGPGGDGDTDPCGTELHAELVDPASEGTLTFNSDGSFTFFKDTAGAVTFTYMACDDADFCSVVATVTINVQPKPGKVSFAQERNTVNPFGAVGTWSQPFWKGDGSFYTGPGNAVPGPPGAWTYPYAAPTWATSYVTVWGAGQVCNSGQTNVDAGTLYAYLRGTKGTPYTISAQIDVQVSATWPATTDPVQMNNPYASATIKDHTGSYTPSQLGSIRTHTPADPETTSSSESFSMAVTLTATGNGVLKVKLLEIRPTLVGNDEALAGAQAYFTATIYVSAITP